MTVYPLLGNPTKNTLRSLTTVMDSTIKGISVMYFLIVRIKFLFERITSSMDISRISKKHLSIVIEQLKGLSYSDIQTLTQNVIKQKIIKNERALSAFDFMREIAIFRYHGNVCQEDIEFTSYPQDYRNPTHGTFVAGIIEYGDELNHSAYTALPGVRLFDATVYPDEKKEHIYQDDLVEHIREAVERHSNIKIWNLSLGTADEASLDEFSDFGMALDNIQDENDVLIIKSAGNCTNFMRQLPNCQICGFC